VAEGQRRAGGLAPRHLEPRQVAGGGVTCAFGAAEFHHPFGRAKAQARERVHHHAQPVGALQTVVPMVRRVAVHGAEETLEVAASQHLFDFGRQRHGLRHRPLRQHTRMHHQPAVAVQRHGAVAQPVEQRLAVRRLQDVLHGVLAARGARALPQGQQVQVVVAQQALRRVAQGRQAAQHLERVGAAVDQVAQDVERVAAGRKIYLLQQPA
jgi:hypothetical protein